MIGNQTSDKIRRLVYYGVLTAFVIVLQLFAYLVPLSKLIPGATVSMTLTLVPVIVGGALLGIGGGAWLGFVFGCVTAIGCVTGLDAGGGVLFSISPPLTVLVCLVKATAAGVAAALVFRALRHVHTTFAVFVAAVAAPTVNTGLFLLAMFTLFRDTLQAWAGGSANVVTYVASSLILANYVPELLIDLVLSPAVVRILRAVHGEK